MYAPRAGEGRAHPRILYWFRTPPNVRVGRGALDEEAIKRLEATYPAVSFDWTRIFKAAAEERRRSERAAARGTRHVAPARERRDVGEPPRSASHVEERIGRDGLDRLRGLYAELLARATERVSDPARLDRLRAEIERLNPDTWVSDEEARRGISEFDAAYRALRAQLGLRRRSRRRRGARAGGEGPAGGVGGAEGSGGPPASGSAV